MTAIGEGFRSRVEAIRVGLAEAGDPARAAGMRAYMRSAMPFRGVVAKPRRELGRRVVDQHPFADRADWETTVRTVWDGAAFREERYVALDLAGHRSAAAWQDPEAVHMYDHWVVTGAWWDYVDDAASHRIGPILRSHRGELTSMVRSWIGDDDRWRRRVSIICQVGAKTDTDLVLLDAAIVANLADRHFSIRKAIGWALREHAKTDPDWVQGFVARHRHELSPLSYREATRHL